MINTVDDLLEEALQTLYGSQAIEENQLSLDITAGATTIAFTHDTGGISAGSLLSVGLEIMRVWSVDSSSQTASVRRGYRGTTAAGHTAGDLVTVNPKYAKSALLKALGQDVLDLSSPAHGLYRMEAFDLTYNATSVGYDVPVIEGYQQTYRLLVEQAGPGDDWAVTSHWAEMRNQDNASGIRLDIPYGEVGRTVRVQYKRDFVWPDGIALTDNVETETGVPANMHDILVMGMLMRVGPTKEISRNQQEAQGSSRRAEEVPPGSITRSFAATASLRQQRITAEAARLARLYPEFSP